MAPLTYRGRGYSSNRSAGFINNNQRGNVTDARQILQRKTIGNRLRGGITDLSQKLQSRTGNNGRFYQQRGRIGKPLYAGRFTSNYTSKPNQQNRFQSVRAMQNLPITGVQRAARNKFIKVHRGGITVTAKQNPLQKRQQKLANDELEEMTLADLPELENVNLPRTRTYMTEGHTCIPQSLPKENNDSTTVLISNLKHSVTEEDINELFGVVGQMTSAQLLHPGAALVSYVRKEDALTALEYYNNVTLDGMAMHCSILSLDKQKTKPSISSRLGERTRSPLSASFLSPRPLSGSSSFLSPTLQSNSFQTVGLRSRTVQSHLPNRTYFPTRLPNNTKFTVCLN